jgi:hypothetical protein
MKGSLRHGEPRRVIMTHDELMGRLFDPTGYDIKSYDPTLHCDNKCLRAGRCLGGKCDDEIELVERRCQCGRWLAGKGTCPDCPSAS